MRVADLYRPDPAVATPETPLLRAAAAMRGEQAGDLVVVDGDAPCGMLSERTLLHALLSRRADELEALTVADLMTERVITVRESDSVTRALERMRAHGVRHVPVIARDGALLGLLTMDDVLDCITGMLEDIVMLMDRRPTHEAWAGT